MITHIRMKNFKSWKDSGEVELAPLTGFFGTNSSGKSSLLQMLLLLKQTVGSDEVLFFGDSNSLVNLGSFGEVFHGHKEEGSFELQFGCKINTPFTIEFLLPDESGVKIPTSFITDSFTFDAAISWKNRSAVFENIHYCVKTENNEHIVKVNNNPKKIYGDPHNVNDMVFPITILLNEFEKLFSHLYYLGPTRIHTQRRYQWEGRHPGNLGHWGYETINALLSARVRNLKTPHEIEGVPIEQRISDWLQKMDLAYSFSLDWTKGATYEVRIQKTASSPSVTLVDMGYGLSQFLPVLVLCYYAPEGSTLILEQPGIHLHPMVQGQLADLLIDVVTKRKLQILVESHSEYLLTRLQRRIAEKQIPEKNVAIYFCRNNDGASTIEKLEVDEESGDIKNWPENFFGDVMGDMFAMTDKQVESIAEKRTEGNGRCYY